MEYQNWYGHAARHIWSNELLAVRGTRKQSRRYTMYLYMVFNSSPKIPLTTWVWFRFRYRHRKMRKHACVNVFEVFLFDANGLRRQCDRSNNTRPNERSSIHNRFLLGLRDCTCTKVWNGRKSNRTARLYRTHLLVNCESRVWNPNPPMLRFCVQMSRAIDF